MVKILNKICILIGLLLSISVFQAAYSDQYDYNSTPSEFKSDLGRIFLGNEYQNPNTNKQNVPPPPVVKMGFSTNLSCGNLDLDVFSNIDHYKEMLNQTLQNVEGNLITAADTVVKSAPFLIACYSSPSLCAELRHDSFLFNQKLGLSVDACNQVDKFIDNRADQGAKTLKSEAVARCVADKSGSLGSAAAFDSCRNQTGLAFQDFQNSLENGQTSASQRLVDSMANYQSYITKSSVVPDVYNELVSMIGETNVNSDGSYQKIYPTNNVISPEKLEKQYMNNGMNVACDYTKLQSYIDGTNTGSDLFTKNLSIVVKKNMSSQDIYDITSLSSADQKISCAALGRSLAKESGFNSSNQMESSIALGMVNPAIPEPLKNQVKTETDANIRALNQAINSENVPSVKDVQTLIHKFAVITRSRNQAIATSLSSAKASSDIRKIQNLECSDSMSCN